MDYKTLRLGKLPARYDLRTLRLRHFISSLPPIPASFDVDSQYPGFSDSFMFLNDTFGDCVIAGRAHQTLRFEDYEQKAVITISDSDVSTEYFKETGGQDTGLDLITSLNCWRKGWIAAGQTYDIFAYAEVDPKNQDEIKATIYLLNGVYCGVLLPISAQSQTGVGKVWDVDSTPNGAVGSWGGHCIYLVAYNDIGPVCVTWGFRQQMTWAFLYKYSDQCFGVIDDKDKWIANDTLDVNALQGILNDITGNQFSPLAVQSVYAPNGTVGTSYTGLMTASGGTPPYNWSLQIPNLPDAVLPPGLTLINDGHISGTPSQTGTTQSGAWVMDAAKTVTGSSFTITINPVPIPNPPVSCGCPRTITKAFRKLVKYNK